MPFTILFDEELNDQGEYVTVYLKYFHEKSMMGFWKEADLTIKILDEESQERYISIR